ncbi:MAG: PspC domain protein [Frankiales bacterium]|nr:PspC domain protein [Frankiales bacterium]
MRQAGCGTIVYAMTETLSDPLPPPPPPPAARRLVRDPDDKVVAGVCAALGRATDTDPVLWRVVTVALALAGGAGIALYAAAWLLVPRKDQSASFVERQLRRPDRSVNVVGVVLLALIGLVLLALLDDGSGAAVVVVVAGLAYLVVRERRTAPAVPAAEATYEAAGAPSQYGVPPVTPYVPAAPYVPAEPAAPRERSTLGPVTLSAAALVAGVLLVLREAGVDGITAPRVITAAMLVVGAGLVVGTWLGRARWLLAVGIALGLLLVPAAATEGTFDGSAGERTWVPTASDGRTTFRLGAGEAVLDLRRLEPGSVDEIDARVGLGSLVVLVPDDLRVRAQTDVGIGDVRNDGRTGSSDSELMVLGPATGPVLELDLEVGLGEIEVRRVSS